MNEAGYSPDSMRSWEPDDDAPAEPTHHSRLVELMSKLVILDWGVEHHFDVVEVGDHAEQMPNGRHTLTVKLRDPPSPSPVADEPDMEPPGSAPWTSPVTAVLAKDDAPSEPRTLRVAQGARCVVCDNPLQDGQCIVCGVRVSEGAEVVRTPDGILVKTSTQGVTILGTDPPLPTYPSDPHYRAIQELLRGAHAFAPSEPDPMEPSDYFDPEDCEHCGEPSTAKQHTWPPALVTFRDALEEARSCSINLDDAEECGDFAIAQEEQLTAALRLLVEMEIRLRALEEA
jgi:hypothetical protein